MFYCIAFFGETFRKLFVSSDFLNIFTSLSIQPGHPLSIHSDATRTTGQNVGIDMERKKNDCVARNSMYMDFFQPLPSGTSQTRTVSSNVMDHNIVSDAIIADHTSSTSLPSSTDSSILDAISSSESIRGILEVVDPFTVPQKAFHRGKSSKITNIDGSHTKKKKNDGNISSSTSSSSSNDSKESVSNHTNAIIASNNLSMNINVNMTHINSIFNHEHHTGLESLSW